jgi:hypothetical protein
MRSAAASALLLACACGNLSNEDLAYLSAIPRKGELRVEVPQDPSAQPLCGPGTYGNADSWMHARKTGDDINAAVDGLVSLVEVIRTTSPTQRGEDDRTWGPFADQQHPGVQIRVRMARELDASNKPWRYLYVFEARRSGDYLSILTGEFYGAQAKGGIGKLVLHFENMALLQINQPTDPTQPMRVFYDLSGDPRSISVDLTQAPGAQLARFDYFWAGYADGHGRFDYAFQNANGCTLSLSSRFTPQGAGRAGIHFECPLSRGDVDQCWDAQSCVTFVNDPLDFTKTCPGGAPCGVEASCAFPRFP